MKSKKTNAKRQVVSHTVQPVVGPSEWEGPQFGIWYPYPDIKPRPPLGHEKCECIVYAKWPVGGTVLGAVFTKTPVGKGRWNDGRRGQVCGRVGSYLAQERSQDRRRQDGRVVRRTRQNES